MFVPGIGVYGRQGAPVLPCLAYVHGEGPLCMPVCAPIGIIGGPITEFIGYIQGGGMPNTRASITGYTPIERVSWSNLVSCDPAYLDMLMDA